MPRGSRSTGAAIDVSGIPHTISDAWNYQVDLMQRSVLFLDILRQRGDNMLLHERAGLPALLDFDHEVVLDARQFAEPANYALLRIVGPKRGDAVRASGSPRRPLIVFDPRAGHGPGIGGFKRDSEVGIALQQGFPVYFVIFFPEPCPGQTLADVHHALRRFVREVSQRHDGQAPVLYGNCQAGWAVVLLSADCVGVAGPAVLNGAPLSYWSGEPGVNPMRLAGGLGGGIWGAHWLADLGNGRFDGAWLAQNFEFLNPAHTLWEKNYHVFDHVDEERQRFLDFERWWSGFYHLNRDEIVAIVENLFVGNRLEQGLMRICECCVADLKRIRNPILIFASSGDDITPPHQALNWIPAIYPTTEALKAAGQRIVYLLNPHVGHLGIFVSASVARREHRAILEHVDELEALEPGLYEMKIIDGVGASGVGPLRVVFEPREVAAIRHDYPQHAFEQVRDWSQFGEALYSNLVSPWVRAMSNPVTAEFLKWLHPMRTSRYLFSERVNPAMAFARLLANEVRSARAPVEPDNPYRVAERAMSEAIADTLEAGRRVRDQACEVLFESAFGRTGA